MKPYIPESHHDLLDRPIVVSLATLMTDLQPQVTPMWCNRRGDQVWINSTLGRQKDRNMRRRPQVTILVVDPEDVYRWLEIRGQVVDMVTGRAAVDHINELSYLYQDRPYANMSADEARCIYKIDPVRVNYR